MSPDEKEREREKEKGCIKHKEGHSTVWIPVKLFWRTLSSSSPSPMLSQHTSPLEILCRSLKGVLLSLDFQTSCTPPPPTFHPPSHPALRRQQRVVISFRVPFLATLPFSFPTISPENIGFRNEFEFRTDRRRVNISQVSLSPSLSQPLNLSLEARGEEQASLQGKKFYRGRLRYSFAKYSNEWTAFIHGWLGFTRGWPLFFSFYDKKRVKKRRIFGIIYFRPYRCCL